MSGDLYDAAIVAAARAKVGAGRLEAPTHSVTCDNPLCGDRVTLDLGLDGPRLTSLAHKTRGCLLTQAAASALAEHAPGHDLAELRGLYDRVRAMLRDGEPPPWPALAMFQPVRAVPSRFDCVLLPFRALGEALDQEAAKR